MEPENVPFLSICSLYTGYNYMRYSLIGKMRLSFIDSDLLYKNAALYEHLSFIYRLKLHALFINGGK